MNLDQRISAFSKLGEKFGEITDNDLFEISRRAQSINQWFTEENIKDAFNGLATMLDPEKIKSWTSKYNLKNPEVPHVIGIIMAGNIPLVGFHDLLCVLISGHFAAIKTSSQDDYLVRVVVEWLIEIEPKFKKNIEIRDRLTSIDALLATGSDNTARYFEYYFKNHPKIIRKNRTSVAVLDGSETEKELVLLGNDIFRYFGLGCRNVSKIFTPKNYDHGKLFRPLEVFAPVGDHNKYRNNYDYYKSIFLVNRTPHLDNGFLLLLPSRDLVSPISVLYTEEYAETEELINSLEKNEKIQCVVSREHIPFGQAQQPELWDYADHVDTLKFLDQLN